MNLIFSCKSISCITRREVYIA